MVTGVGDLVGADELAGDLEDAPVHRLEEMLRLEEIGDAVEGLVVDQDGAEQRLFGLDVLRRGAIGLPGVGDRAGGKCHSQSILPFPRATRSP